MWKYKRKPTPPGEILSEEFIKPMGLTQKKLADHMGIDVKVINRICNEKSSITPVVAVKLASTFGMSAEFWLNAQNATDLWKIKESGIKLPEKLSVA
ncbi:HigA family addiction module antidote protein [bacterium]|nr:HigA family addiction module antidote protein [bacterium]